MYLSLCLIAKNENSYLQEWLDYHILLGVEHFWIYDNESAVPLAETVKEYIDSGRVTVHTIKGRAMQIHAYDHCIQTYGSTSTWIGFIDTDEFLVPVTTVSLQEFLKPFEPYAGFAVSSLFFGSNGNVKRPAGGQIAGYTRRTPNRYSRNRLVKMIVQPGKVMFPLSPHSFLFKEGCYCVNENGYRVDSQEFPCHIDTIQLNHYFTRSQQEWEEKMKRGGGAGIAYSDARWTQVHTYSTQEDTRIFDLLKKILPNGPSTEAGWSKLFNKSETHLLTKLRQAAGDIPVPDFTPLEVTEVHPRPEVVEFKKEMGVGTALLDAGKIVEARNFLAGQINKCPFDPIRYTNFASVCLQLKEYQTAWNAIAQAWRLAPQSLYVLHAMTDYFFAIGDYAQTEKTCLLAAAQGDPEPISIAILALAQYRQGRQQGARETARPILPRLTPRDLENPIFAELAALMKS